MVPGYAISRFAAKLGKKKHNRFKKMFVINMKYVIMEQIYDLTENSRIIILCLYKLKKNLIIFGGICKKILFQFIKQ